MAFKRILVAIDGSEISEKVLDSVTGLADRFGSELLLLAVTGSHADFSEALDNAAEEKNSDVAIGDNARGAERYLEHIAAPLRGQGLTVTKVVQPGIPVDTILSVAKESEVDLIAMATHRESALARGILGSVTDAVLRSSSVPVLAMHPDGTSMTTKPRWIPSTVVVPLDGSQLAEECVPTALEIAKACGSEVVFLQAVHLPSFAVSGPGSEYYGVDYGVSSKRAGAREYLKQFVEIAESQGLSATSHAALGNAAARIIEETKSVPDAMIVISSHGRSGFKRMVLGSVADKIIRASHHPVLVLKHAQ